MNRGGGVNVVTGNTSSSGANNRGSANKTGNNASDQSQA